MNKVEQIREEIVNGLFNNPVLGENYVNWQTEDGDCGLTVIYKNQKEKYDITIKQKENVPENDSEIAKDEIWDKEEVWEAIHELSDIRARYNLFNPKQRPKYHACSLAIQALREVINEPCG